jgi:TonB family protein
MIRTLLIIAIMLPDFASGSSTQIGAAIDAAGVYHKASDYAGTKPPWIQDINSSLAPNYPIDDRIQGHEGVGLYHLQLDLKTGRVTNATVITSTGFKGLDVSATWALRQWRWKAGRWKEIDMPVRFVMSANARQQDLAEPPFLHVPVSGGAGLRGRP